MKISIVTVAYNSAATLRDTIESVLAQIFAADYKFLIRFLCTHRLSSRYLAFDFMKIRTGGVSTQSGLSNLRLNREIVRAYREKQCSEQS